MLEDKTYLGDSVYVEVDKDDGSLILTTENGKPNDPSNTIFLEPQIMANLIRFHQKNLHCDHSEMVTTNVNDPNHVWKCTKCGYVAEKGFEP